MSSQLSLGIDLPRVDAKGPSLPSAPKPALHNTVHNSVINSGRRRTKKPRKVSGEAKEAMIAEARTLLQAYNDAALACDRRKMIGLSAMIEDLAKEARPGEALYPALENLFRHLAAPDGQVPMHGQPGRFVLTVAGARCAITYAGISRASVADVEALDFGKPWLSRSAVLILSHVGGIDMLYRRPGEGVGGFIRRAIVSSILATSENLKSEDEIPLVEMRRRWCQSVSGGGIQDFDERIASPNRSWHKDWQPGGFWHGLATGIEA